MADLPRSAKSGSDWTRNDPAAYNITVHCQAAQDFFGYEPNEIAQTIDQDFVTAAVPPTDNFSDSTYQLLQYIHLATCANPGQESAVQDVAREVLRLVKVEERGILLRSRYSLPFMVNGDIERVAQTDLCLTHGSSTILFVIRVDTIWSRSDREAQVIAYAIAAFRFNNNAREQSGLDKLESMTIPAITMFGTRPTFYKIPVTRALSDAVARAQYPFQQTTVRKCVVVPRSHCRSEGMESPEFRQDILRHYEAFRRIAKGCWEIFVA